MVGIVYGSIIVVILLAGARREALAAAFATLGAAALHRIATDLVARPRPSPALVHVAHALPLHGSFPAGHVQNATAFLGFLAYLLARGTRSPWRWLGVALLTLVIVGMGVARVYFGEHWLSDVVGGYVLGGVWLCVAIELHHALERRTGRRAPVGRLAIVALAGGALLSVFDTRSARAYRPFDFTDADVARLHSLEFEMGPEFARRGDERTVRSPRLESILGLGAGYEVSVAGTNLVRTESVLGEARPRLVDVGVSIKKLLREGNLQEKQGPSLATEEFVTFPSGDQTHLGVEASAILSSTGPPGVVHVNALVERSPEGHAGAGMRVIVEAQDNEGWRPALELDAEGAEHEAPEQRVTLAGIYEMHEGLAYDLGVQLGRSSEEHWTEVRSGVTWELKPEDMRPLQHFARFHLRRRR